jgi:hypothetical protein
MGYKWAKNRNLRTSYRRLAAGCGFLLVFLPIFWDTIPTLAAHHWYCNQEAGFHLYKSLDQWKRENPGVAETLRTEDVGRPPPIKIPGTFHAYTVNGRFRVEARRETRAWGIRSRDERLVDSKNGEVIAKFLDFSTGIPNVLAHGAQSFRDLKVWMDRNYCIEGREESGLNRWAAIVDEASWLGWRN